MSVAHHRSHVLQDIVLSDKIGWEYAHLIAELTRPPALVAGYLGIRGQHLDDVASLEAKLVLTLCLIVVDGRPQWQVGGGRLVLVMGGVLVLVVRRRGGGVGVRGFRAVEVCGPRRRVRIAQVGTSETRA